MKDLGAILLLFWGFITNAQEAKIQGERVDSIIIRSHSSVYLFDEDGTTRGEIEELRISYLKETGKFVICSHVRDTYKRTFREPGTFDLESKAVDKSIGSGLEYSLLENLITSFSKSLSGQQNLEKLDTDEFVDHLTERKARSIIQRYKAGKGSDLWHSKKELHNIINQCRSLEYLNVYFRDHFDTTGYTMITDVESSIRVWFVTSQNRYSYEGKYPNPVKQPWYYHSTGLPKAVFNLEINSALEKVLPKGFLLKETISFEALVDDYIYWCLGGKP